VAGLPASGGRTRAGVHNFLKSLDSGPFDKPFDTLRVPSLSRDFHRNDE